MAVENAGVSYDWDNALHNNTAYGSAKAGRAHEVENRGFYLCIAALGRDYGEYVNSLIVEAGRQACRRLVKRTSETAPVGRRLIKRKFDEDRPHLFESFSMMRIRTMYGWPAWLWYTRAPNSRIAHLVENGHAQWERDSRGRAIPGSADRWVHGSGFIRAAVEIERERYHQECVKALEDNGYAVKMKYVTEKRLDRRHEIIKIGDSK